MCTKVDTQYHRWVKTLKEEPLRAFQLPLHSYSPCLYSPSSNISFRSVSQLPSPLSSPDPAAASVGNILPSPFHHLLTTAQFSDLMFGRSFFSSSFLNFLNVYLFLRERDRARAEEGRERERERGRHRIQRRLQAPSCQHRA